MFFLNHKAGILTSRLAIGNSISMANSHSHPTISGFTIARNAMIMGYPILESILSVLPLVDEFVVGLGPCDDDTENQIMSLNSPKIRIIHSDWDSKKYPNGTILSAKTNEALAHCKNNWCIYIQADEVLHEDDHIAIKRAILDSDSSQNIQGLLFQYIHFYGSYKVIATSRKWYRNEVRVVKKNSGIQSWNDAQGFRVDGQKPIVKKAHARVFHYGWVKPPTLMGEKKKRLDQLWHGGKKDIENSSFQFQKFYGLKNYTGTHPTVMKKLIENQDWNFNYKMGLMDWTLKDFNCLFSDIFEKCFNVRIGEYKNYRLL